jgi:hypothetical protein
VSWFRAFGLGMFRMCDFLIVSDYNHLFAMTTDTIKLAHEMLIFQRFEVNSDIKNKELKPMQRVQTAFTTSFSV